MRAFAILLALLATPALAANCKTSGPGDIAIDCTPLRVQAAGVLNQWTPTIYHRDVVMNHPLGAASRVCQLSGQAAAGDPNYFVTGSCGIKYAKRVPPQAGRVRMYRCQASGSAWSCGWIEARFAW